MSAPKLTLYSASESQWAKVPELALLEKGFGDDEYDIQWFELSPAENFNPEYVAINPNGTVPSLSSPELTMPLTDTRPILEHLDQLRPDAAKLTSDEPSTQARMNELIDLVHRDNMSTNLILLQARDKQEMEAKRAAPWKDFVTTRQQKLEHHREQLPDHPFYASKLKDTTPLHNLYTAPEVGGEEFEEFFAATHGAYGDFAAGLNELNSLIVLPFVTGPDITLADLHIAPWLSHAMWGSGATDIHDFAPLEALIAKSVPGFKVGDRIKEWWKNMAERKSFKTIYPKLR